MTLLFTDLRIANATRHRRYYRPGQKSWSHDDWMVALEGEAGEALNLIKKLNRDRDGMAGNRSDRAELRAQLGDELADVAIYLDIYLATRSNEHLGAYSHCDDFGALRALTGRHARDLHEDPTLSKLGTRLMRALTGLDWVHHEGPEQAVAKANYAVKAIDAVAFGVNIDLGAAITGKFNATSEKLGFPERLPR